MTLPLQDIGRVAIFAGLFNLLFKIAPVGCVDQATNIVDLHQSIQKLTALLPQGQKLQESFVGNVRNDRAHERRERRIDGLGSDGGPGATTEQIGLRVGPAQASSAVPKACW